MYIIDIDDKKINNAYNICFPKLHLLIKSINNK